MNKKELQELLISEIKQNKGNTPRSLMIDGTEWIHSSSQRVGEYTLFRFRENKVEEYKEKSIMVAL